MKLLRRALIALWATVIVFGCIRLRGRGGVPPQCGGWREFPTGN
jgi:hypothetical protein